MILVEREALNSHSVSLAMPQRFVERIRKVGTGWAILNIFAPKSMKIMVGNFQF